VYEPHLCQLVLESESVMRSIVVVLIFVFSGLSTYAVTTRHTPGGGGADETPLKCGKQVKNENGASIWISCNCSRTFMSTIGSSEDWIMTIYGPLTTLSTYSYVLCRESDYEAGNSPSVTCAQSTDCNGGQEPSATEHYQGYCPWGAIPYILGQQDNWPPY
jgi:hypothetical protein